MIQPHNFPWLPAAFQQPQDESQQSRYNMSDKTSIVIPTYNAKDTLADAIESAMAQGVDGKRLIVVDDGSTDGSPEIARRYGESVTLVEKQNGGASSARNAGLSLVTSRYVLFLDADDLYEGLIVAGLQRAAEATAADLAFGTSHDVNPAGIRCPARQTPPDPASPDAFLAAWLNGHSVPTNSQFWRTEFLREIGGWNERMSILEEIEVPARGILRGARIATSLEGTSLYRHHPTPTRVGYGSSEQVVRSAIDGFFELAPLTTGWSAAVCEALGRRFYIQARTAYRLGYPGLGNVAYPMARKLGFTGHTGTVAHCILANAVGLARKEAIARLVR